MPRFTDRFLTSLALEEGQKDRIVFDADCPGLGVRLSASGTRSFIAQWTDRATGKKRREPLGRWGAITIEQARTAARAILGDVARGGDPAAERARRKASAEAEKADAALTLRTMLEQWAERHLVNRRARYAAEAPSALRRIFAEDLDKPASQISRQRVLEALDEMVGQGKTAMALQTLTYGRAAFGWAMKREKVKANPFVSLPPVGKAVDRERTLSADEATEVWQAACALPFPWGPFFRMALLTLQRREEVAGMRWSELSADLSLWSIPGSRMKNGKPHAVALPKPARELLHEVPRHQVDGKLSDFVFTTSGRTPISGFSKAKITLDAALAAIRQGKVGEPFRLHDFRRSGASWLAGAGFDTVAIDKLLAHQPTKLRGVAAVYQRYAYADERRRALEAWAAMVTK